MADRTYHEGESFPGRIGLTLAGSEPAWPVRGCGCGYADGTPVTEAYASPFRFTGMLHDVRPSAAPC